MNNEWADKSNLLRTLKNIPIKIPPGSVINGMTEDFPCQYIRVRKGYCYDKIIRN